MRAQRAKPTFHAYEISDFTLCIFASATPTWRSIYENRRCQIAETMERTAQENIRHLPRYSAQISFETFGAFSLIIDHSAAKFAGGIGTAGT